MVGADKMTTHQDASQYPKTMPTGVETRQAMIVAGMMVSL